MSDWVPLFPHGIVPFSFSQTSGCITYRSPPIFVQLFQRCYKAIRTAVRRHSCCLPWIIVCQNWWLWESPVDFFKHLCVFVSPILPFIFCCYFPEWLHQFRKLVQEFRVHDVTPNAFVQKLLVRKPKLLSLLSKHGTPNTSTSNVQVVQNLVVRKPKLQSLFSKCIAPNASMSEL